MPIDVIVPFKVTVEVEMGDAVEVLKVGGVATITEVVAVVVPFGFVAVIVKVVVEVGFTVADPMRVEVEKLPGVMATELAFVMLQESVLVPADTTTPGDAEKETMEGRAPL